MTVASKADFAKIPLLDRIPGLRDFKPEPIPWLVSQLFPEQSIILLSGRSGNYKSWIALDASYAVLTGGVFADLSAVKRPVLYLDKENGRAQIARRLESMGLVGAPALDEIQYWGSWVPLNFPGADSEPLLEWAKQKRGLAVFDSLKRFHRADENDSSQMSVVMERFIALRDAGATVLLIHHSGKGEGNFSRGAEEIVAACDVCYHVSRDAQEKRLVTLAQFKNRITEERSTKVRLDESGRFSLEG